MRYSIILFLICFTELLVVIWCMKEVAELGKWALLALETSLDSGTSYYTSHILLGLGTYVHCLSLRFWFKLEGFLIFDFITDSFQGAALFLESFGIKGFWLLGLSIMTLNILLSKHGLFSYGYIMLFIMYCTSFFITLSEYSVVRSFIL